TVRFVVRQLERAAGTRTLREVSAFFVALDALFGDVSARAARARALLAGERTAFVLVVGPKERGLADAGELVSAMESLNARPRAAVANRVHPLSAAGESDVPTAEVERL